MSTYAVVIENAGSNFSAFVPDLPGCVAIGATVDEVSENIHDAIELYIASSIEYGERVPLPSSRGVYVEVGS